MQLQEIEVIIDPTGEVRIAINGVKGKQCLELTQALEAALGNQLITRELTPEADEVVFNIEANRIENQQR